MSKIVILKNQTYLSSKAIYHSLEGGGRVSLENALNHIYPVGSIFITTVNQDPSPYLGGKWEAFGAGRVLVGFDSSQTEFNTILKTGGEKTHTLTIDEMPNHTHGLHIYGTDKVSDYVENTLWGNAQAYNNFLSYTGGNQPHNNLQPYIVVYMFKRIN